MRLPITCQDCGKVLGNVEYKRVISLEEAQARANCYRCGECAATKQQADAKAQADRTAAVQRLLDDAESARTVDELRGVLKQVIGKLPSA